MQKMQSTLNYCVSPKPVPPPSKPMGIVILSSVCTVTVSYMENGTQPTSQPQPTEPLGLMMNADHRLAERRKQWHPPLANTPAHTPSPPHPPMPSHHHPPANHTDPPPHRTHPPHPAAGNLTRAHHVQGDADDENENERENESENENERENESENENADGCSHRRADAAASALLPRHRAVLG